MEIEINNNELETIEIAGNPQKIWGVGKAKSFKGAMQGKISHFMKHPKATYSGRDVEVLLRGLSGLYDNYHPTKTVVEVKGWKGKAGIARIRNMIDSYEVTRFRKKHKDSEPEPFINRIPKKDVDAVIRALRGFVGSKKIKSEVIAGQYCRLKGLRENKHGQPLFDEQGFIWSHFFGHRILHVTFVDILGILNEAELISYKAGFVEILDLDKELEFQSNFN